jgi:predicted aspartyl protease
MPGLINTNIKWSVYCVIVLALIACFVSGGESATKTSTRQETRRAVPAARVHPPVAEELPLNKVRGVYELLVEVNGVLTLPFVLDSGAADVQIPADVAFTLYRTGTIADADFLPGSTYILADGFPMKSERFMLRSLQVGRQRLTNIPASIGSLASMPLLGQSFLKRLEAWSVDNQREVLVVKLPTEVRHTLEVSPLRLSCQVGTAGKLLTLQLEATNTSQHAGHGMILVYYPAHLVSMIGLHSPTGETAVAFSPSPVRQAAPADATAAYQLLQTAWPAWRSGERRLAMITLIPRLPQNIMLYLSVVLDEGVASAAPQRWGSIVRIPVH